MSTALNQTKLIYNEKDVDSLLSEFTSTHYILQKRIEVHEQVRGIASKSGVQSKRLVSIEIYARRL